MNVLYGHGESINEIKTHPTHPHILLTCSADRSIRMWNINTLVCISIFAGEKGHTENVIDIDIHPLGNVMVSGGADTNIMIWNLQDPCLLNTIAQSDKHSAADKFTFPTYIQQVPLYTTNRVHVGYIDMCVWVHDLLLTKSTNDRIVLWAVDANRYKGAFCVLREFKLRESAIWFMRGGVCMPLQIIGVGNGAGQVS
ncbi:hypothetical protein EON65_25980 [archaeon]|nr:MAG: hypothetical protein EON65_25980 [archaeon]